MDKILFLTTELPYPLDSGGKIRTYNMLKGLASNFDIDIVCFSEKIHIEDDLNELKKICNDVKVIKKIYTNSKSKYTLIKNVIMGILYSKPFIINKFDDSIYRAYINDSLRNNIYSKIIVDHLQVAQFIPEKYMKNAILSQHNCEYLIIKRMYEKSNNFIKKLYLKTEYEKLKKYEINTCKKFSKVILLSEEDKEYLVGSEYDGNNTRIVPISVSSEFIKQNKCGLAEKINILFMGTMSWLPNQQGILWFLENVWDEIDNGEYNLFIVGKNPPEEIKKYKSKNIIITGYVEDINEYIEKCDFSIVPLFIGGGMRVKILESMVKGLPTISTTIGAEGIEVQDGENILIANTKEEFIMKINNLKNKELYDKLIIKGIELIDEKYSIDAVNKRVINIIQEN